jgi:hypothetical protein
VTRLAWTRGREPCQPAPIVAPSHATCRPHQEAANASRACTKHSSGACTTPAPI